MAYKDGNTPATIALSLEARKALKELGVLLTPQINKFPVRYSDVVMELHRMCMEVLNEEKENED